ncbi:MAG: phosphomannomutase/phosphoglucomutase [Haliangiales bacterium]
MNPAVFRAYDIRGQAERDLSDELVRGLGCAIGSHFAARAAEQRAADPAGAAAEPAADGSAPRLRVALGRDCRLSSPRLWRALSDGLRAVGVDLIDLGVVPTPVVYFAAHQGLADGAVQITGSHNPAGDNGFKMLFGARRLDSDAIQSLRGDVERGAFVQVDESRRGVVERRDLMDEYLDRVVASVALGPRRCKVVVDASNGVGGPAAVALYRRLGFEVVPLYCDMDGRFPNHPPDPIVPENLADLRRAVAAHGAELGLALDGDADRVAAVDARGRILWGDQLMILYGREVLEAHPGASVVVDIKCSRAVIDELTAAGGHVDMWRAGHSLIKARMDALGAKLAGELSGHIFFADRWPGFDDGIYAGARLLAILSRSQTTLAAHCDTLPQMVNTPELRVACPDERKFARVARAAATLRARDDVVGVLDIDGVRVDFGDGWGLVRASNTEPAIVLRCEARTEARLSEIRALLEGAVTDAG